MLTSVDMWGKGCFCQTSAEARMPTVQCCGISEAKNQQQHKKLSPILLVIITEQYQEGAQFHRICKQTRMPCDRRSHKMQEFHPLQFTKRSTDSVRATEKVLGHYAHQAALTPHCKAPPGRQPSSPGRLFPPRRLRWPTPPETPCSEESHPLPPASPARPRHRAYRRRCRELWAGTRRGTRWWCS